MGFKEDVQTAELPVHLVRSIISSIDRYFD